MSIRLCGRQRRKYRIRRRVSGTPERPRLSVFRSARHIYAQVIDDTQSVTLASASTQSPDLRNTLEKDSKTQAAKKVGALIAKICLARSIQKVVFDRNGYLYHGRIQALADAAREGGLKF
jgi:large subunit ribosomal protein L18